MALLLLPRPLALPRHPRQVTAARTTTRARRVAEAGMVEGVAVVAVARLSSGVTTKSWDARETTRHSLYELLLFISFS
jgi:hypothetical protein